MLSEREIKLRKLTLLRIDPYIVGMVGGRLGVTLPSKTGLKAGDRVYQYIDDRGNVILVPQKKKKK